MTATSVSSISARNAMLWAIAWFCLGTMACVRGLDVSKVKCVGNASCPKGYSCRLSPGENHGDCVSDSTLADGGGVDQAITLVSDAPVTGGRSLDGSHGTGGATTTVVGLGGAGGATVGPSSGGAAGAITGLGGVAGGTGGTIGPRGTGGATSSDAGPDAPTTLANGSACTLDEQCTNGHCVDGVCCDSSCDGQCQACNEKANPGQCVTVQGDPRGTRPTCSGTAPCKGQCDGKTTSTCSYPGSSTVCTPAGCTAGMATPASVCNSTGACTKPTASPCPTNLCASDGSGKCSDSCTATSCSTGYYCSSTGVCTRKADPGTACANGNECASGFCSDGICCLSACGGQCQVCNAAGSCVRVVGSPRPGHTPCVATSATCAGTCDGTSDSCVYKGAEAACTTATCASVSMLNNPTVCNGAGACTSASQTNCASTNKYCSTNQCVARLGDGQSCTSSLQCEHDNCSGGTCCGAGLTGCSGTCVNLATSSTNCGQCGRSCPAGQSCCSGTCFDLKNSNTNCGACDRSCGSQVCLSGICCDAIDVNCGGACCDTNHTCTGSSCTCPGYSLSCGGCPVWNFETNTTEGWIKTPASLREAAANNAVQSLSASMSRYAQGTHSLAVQVSTTTTNNVAAFAVPLCPSGAAVSLPANITFTASFYFNGSVTMPSFTLSSAELYGPSDYKAAQDSTIGTSTPSGTWFTYHATFSSATTASHVGFFWMPGSAWSGTIYVDGVKLAM